MPSFNGDFGAGLTRNAGGKCSCNGQIACSVGSWIRGLAWDEDLRATCLAPWTFYGSFQCAGGHVAQLVVQTPSFYSLLEGRLRDARCEMRDARCEDIPSSAWEQLRQDESEQFSWRISLIARQALGIDKGDPSRLLLESRARWAGDPADHSGLSRQPQTLTLSQHQATTLRYCPLHSADPRNMGRLSTQLSARAFNASHDQGCQAPGKVLMQRMPVAACRQRWDRAVARCTS